jgi:hypothetical protein
VALRRSAHRRDRDTPTVRSPQPRHTRRPPSAFNAWLRSGFGGGAWASA